MSYTCVKDEQNNTQIYISSNHRVKGDLFAVTDLVKFKHYDQIYCLLALITKGCRFHVVISKFDTPDLIYQKSF